VPATGMVNSNPKGAELEVGDWFEGARRAWRVANAFRTAVDDARRQNRERHILWSRSQDEATPPEQLAELAGHSDPMVRANVGRNPHTPQDALRRLVDEAPPGRVRDGEIATWTTRAAVAANPSVPADLRAALAGDEEAYVRGAVAGNNATTPDELVQLATDTDELVRMTVAANSNTPVGVLVQFAETADLDREMALSLIDNPNCPEEARARLRSSLRDSEPEAEADDQSSKSERFLPFGLAKLAGGVLFAQHLAHREEHDHPDDPGIAILGPRSGLLKRQAMELASDDREDRQAAEALVRRAQGHDEALKRAALWLRCDGQASEQLVENRAHRLLKAALSGEPVQQITESERRLIEELESLRARPGDGFDALVDKEPRLRIVADAIQPVDGMPPQEDLSVEPVRSWVAISFPFATRALSRTPVLGTRVPPAILALIGQLEDLVGPTSASPDPVLRSHTAVNIALKHCVPLLYPAQ
jgi:hypothetical protein